MQIEKSGVDFSQQHFQQRRNCGKSAERQKSLQPRMGSGGFAVLRRQEHYSTNRKTPMRFGASLYRMRMFERTPVTCEHIHLDTF